YKAPNGQNVHVAKLLSGTINTGETYTLTVSREDRNVIIKNHTATHLLHQALKDTLGSNVNQAGSLVEKERLRFDFSHLEVLSEAEIIAMAVFVSEKIYENL